MPHAQAVCALLLTCCLASLARAGGGPENVFLVVNPQSPASLCIANHYAAWRQIPAVNVFYLAWDPKAETTDVDTFRQRILRPTLEAVRASHLGRQIDYIVYSSDFPWGIALDADVKKFTSTMGDLKKPEASQEEHPEPSRPATWPTFLTPVGSINGLTYLWEPVLMAQPGYFGRHSNWYARSAASEPGVAPTLAFSSGTLLGPHGEVVATNGRHYLLSMMLGVTAGRGNSLDEVLSYLRRSAAADGAHPAGTIYYVENSDVRSQVRQGEYPSAVRQLKALGVAAEILDGTVPSQKDDVQGTMLGTAQFDWKASGSTILPGAICEHFTSFGGEMNSGAGQTPLSEFLRYGAAAASGTVTEPYAIADKFPAALMHVHYARGCTVAEAFYQSILCPYQLLIVGDPLCRPWANIPEVSVAGVQPGATVKGTIRLQPSARFPHGAVADHFELFIDGLRQQRCDSGGSLEVDTARLADGYHELRIVAVEKGPIRSQGRRIVPIVVANRSRTLQVTVSPTMAATTDPPIVVTVKAPGCAEVVVARGTQILARLAGEEGRLEIRPAVLGAGPVRLQAIGLGKEGPAGNVVSQPVDVVIKAGTNPP